MLELAKKKKKGVERVITVFHTFNVYSRDLEKDLSENFTGESYNA